MTTSEPSQLSHGTDARPARPGARRYYVWRAAMWFTIVHTALFGMLTIITRGWVNLFPGIHFNSVGTMHVELARSWTEPPVLPMLAGFLLVPIAVIACYRASMRKRAMGWLLGYWLSAATICVLSVSALFVLNYCTGSKPCIPLSCRYFANDAMYFCAICPPPLPVTLLAALLTIERKKRPPAVEARA